MRIVSGLLIAAAAAMVSVAAAEPFKIDLSPAADKVDLFTPGEYTESFEVPNGFTCPQGEECHAFAYVLDLSGDFPGLRCVGHTDVWMRAADGTDIPFVVRETGTRGVAGYTLEYLSTAEFSGMMTFHVRVIDRCAVRDVEMLRDRLRGLTGVSALVGGINQHDALLSLSEAVLDIDRRIKKLEDK